jgi:hypothetical protein
MDQQDVKYLTVTMLARRWSVSTMFVERRIRDPNAKAAGFPQPIRLTGAQRKRLFPVTEIESYERASAALPPPRLKPLPESRMIAARRQRAASDPTARTPDKPKRQRRHLIGGGA